MKNVVKNLKKYPKTSEYWKMLKFIIYSFVTKIGDVMDPSLHRGPVSLHDYRITVLIYLFTYIHVG